MLSLLFVCFFFFKQKAAYELRISDWSSVVCSSDLQRVVKGRQNCESGPSRGQLSGFHPPFDDSNVSLSRLPKGSGFHPPYHRGFTHPTIGVSPTESRGFTHRRNG